MYTLRIFVKILNGWIEKECLETSQLKIILIGQERHNKIWKWNREIFYIYTLFMNL